MTPRTSTTPPDGADGAAPAGEYPSASGGRGAEENWQYKKRPGEPKASGDRAHTVPVGVRWRGRGRKLPGKKPDRA